MQVAIKGNMTYSLNIRDGYSSIPDDDGDDNRAGGDENKPAPTKINHRTGALVALVAGLLLALLTVVVSKSWKHGDNDNNDVVDVHWDENTPLFYEEQLVDHFGVARSKHLPRYWKHRYYLSTEHYKGPGYPIMCVVAASWNFAVVSP